MEINIIKKIMRKLIILKSYKGAAYIFELSIIYSMIY